MRVRLMGANPFVTLFADERAVAFASVWRVDWSERGPGRALVFGDADGVRVVSATPDLGEWLAESFNRHFTDVVADLPWSPPRITVAPVEFDLDLAYGLRAAGADVAVEIAGPMDRQLTRNDAYDLGGVPNVLSTVWIPCRAASIVVDGKLIDGAPQVVPDPASPYSSAAIAEAEVWCHVD